MATIRVSMGRLFTNLFISDNAEEMFCSFDRVSKRDSALSSQAFDMISWIEAIVVCRAMMPSLSVGANVNQ